MVEWRKYKTLPISTKPLCEGESPVELIIRQRGCVRIVANSAMRDDGKFNVSLRNQKTGNCFSKLMTKHQLTIALKNDGVTPVWVNDNFEYGELKCQTIRMTTKSQSKTS